MKFGLLGAGIALCVGLVTTLWSGQIMEKGLHDSLRARGNYLSQTLAEAEVLHVINRNVLSTRESLRRMVAQVPDVRYVFIEDFDGGIFAHSFDGGFPRALLSFIQGQESKANPIETVFHTPQGPITHINFPLIPDLEGAIHIGLDEALAQSHVTQLRFTVISISLLVGMMGMLAAFIMSYQVTRPLGRLTKSMRDFGNGAPFSNLKLKVATGSSEVFALQSAFMRMLDQRYELEMSLRQQIRRNELILSNTQDGFCIAELDGLIKEPNDAFCKMLGYDPDELTTKTLVEVGSADQRKALKTLLENTVNSVYGCFETNLQRIDGRILEVEINATLAELEKDRFLFIFLRDITERKTAEKALRENERRLRKVVENMPVMLDALDIDGNIIAWNREAERVTGYTSEEIVGNPKAMELLYPDDSYRERMLKEWQQKGNRYRRWEWKLRDKSGRVRTVSWSNISDEFPISEWATWGIGEDITELKQAQEELARIFNLSLDMLCVAGTDGYLKRINPAFQRILGYPLNTLLAKPFLDFIHPADRQSTQCAVQALAAGQTVQNFENRFLDMTGSYHWIQWSSASVPEQGHLYAVARDVTEQKRAEHELRESERKLYTLISNLPGVAYRCVNNKRWSMEYISEGCFELTGYPPESIVYDSIVSFSDLILQQDQAAVWNNIQDALLENRPFNLEYRIRARNGSLKWVSEKGRRVKNAEGELRLEGFISDITERKRTEEELRQAATVFESTVEGVTITDPDANILVINRAFTHITGYAGKEAVGQNSSILKSGRHDISFYQSMWAALTQVGNWQGEIWNRRKNGEIYPEWLTISAIRDQDNGAVINYVAVFSDITPLKRSQEQLQRLAHHDPLTDLPNRLLLNARLTHALKHAQRERRSVALLFLDLDRFKNVNDTLGHPLGDRMLQEVAQRLSACVRNADTLVRLGGDEFVILLEELRHGRDACSVAHKAISALSYPFELENQPAYITASIGISVYPDDGEDVTTLLKNADVAMYHAKDAGGNTYQFYTQDMTQSAFERFSMETAMRQALEKEQFILHYQPQVVMDTGEIVGVEALVRWEHPAMGLISPAKFIPLAEDTGLIEPLGEWVLDASCRQIKSWLENGIQLSKMAVNLSGRQITRGDLLKKVKNILEETGLEPARLQLEITESSIMTNPEAATHTLDGLAELGIGLAVDDFGTGYSSLTYLKRFPVRVLKIDRSFVHDATDDPNDAAICRAVIALAQGLNMNVIAEGVEQESQRLLLIKEGCALGQGYYFSPPLPANKLSNLLKNPDQLK